MAIVSFNKQVCGTVLVDRFVETACPSFSPRLHSMEEREIERRLFWAFFPPLMRLNRTDDDKENRENTARNDIVKRDHSSTFSSIDIEDDISGDRRLGSLSSICQPQALFSTTSAVSSSSIKNQTASLPNE